MFRIRIWDFDLFLSSPVVVITFEKLKVSSPLRRNEIADTSAVDPDPPDSHVFWPPGSGSISQRYGSGSFYHHAKIVRKTLIPTIL